MDKLNLEHDNPQEEQLHITDPLILPPTTDEEKKATTEEKTNAETIYQQEEEKYKLQQKIYMGQLSDEECELVQNIQATVILVKKGTFLECKLYIIQV